MKRRVVALHVGQPKTGTTAIQKWLASNESVFEEAGWRYMRTARSTRGGWNHRGLHISVIARESDPDWRPWDEMRDAIKAEIGEWGGEGCVVSQESIAQLSASRKARVVSAFQLDDTALRVIVYIRNLAEQLDSRYRQMVKATDLTKDFETWLDPEIRLDVLSHMATFSSLLRSRDSLIVRTYSRSRFKNSSILVDFVESVGIPVDPSATSKARGRVNTTLDDELLMFKLEMNKYAGELAHPLGRRLARFAQVRDGERTSLFTQRLWGRLGDKITHDAYTLVELFDLSEDLVRPPTLTDDPLTLSGERGRELLRDFTEFDAEMAVTLKEMMPARHEWLR